MKYKSLRDYYLIISVHYVALLICLSYSVRTDRSKVVVCTRRGVKRRVSWKPLIVTGIWKR